MQSYPEYDGTRSIVLKWSQNSGFGRLCAEKALDQKRLAL